MAFDDSFVMVPLMDDDFEMAVGEDKIRYAMTPYGVPLEVKEALQLQTNDFPEFLTPSEEIKYGAGSFERVLDI